MDLMGSHQVEHFDAPVAKRVHCEGLLLLAQRTDADSFAKESNLIKALGHSFAIRSTFITFVSSRSKRKAEIEAKATELGDLMSLRLKSRNA